MDIDKMFTDPLMSIIDAGAKMFLEYIQRVSSVTTFFQEKYQFCVLVGLVTILFGQVGPSKHKLVPTNIARQCCNLTS